MQLAEWQERDWQRAQRWADACTKGDCRYAQAHPERNDGDPGCPGYHCTLHWEETQPVLRYCNCWRKTAWLKADRERRKLTNPTVRKRGLASDET